MRENKKINLVLCSDQNYIKLLVPCIISILCNKKSNTEIDIYILESGISTFHKKEIKKLAKFNENKVNIEFLNAKENCKNFIDQNINHIYYTSAILYRLAIPKIFKHLDRVLYLDVDTIVRVDLLDFYNQDFENNYCCVKTTYPLTCFTSLYDNKPCISENYSLNSGVVLFNIKKIVEDNKEDELMDIQSKYPTHLPNFLDQDILADTFKSKIKKFNDDYNYIIDHFELTQSRARKFKKEYLEGVKNGKILHFANSIKPFKLNKLAKLDRKSYKIFYTYYQKSYLKINPIKLKLLFLIADIKRLRRYIIGTRKEYNGRKIIYFLNLEIILRK